MNANFGKPIKQILINVKIKYNGGELKFKANMDDKIENIMNQFSSKINKSLTSLFFLYNGQKMNNTDFNKNFSTIMNKINLKSKEIIILAEDLLLPPPGNDYNQLKDIKIMLITDSNEVKKFKKENKDSNLRNIIIREKLDINKYYFYYKNKLVDLEKKFVDLLDENYKKYNYLMINAKHKEAIIVNFLNINSKNKNSSMLCFPEDNLESKCKTYCNDKQINFYNLNFQFNNQFIDFNSNKKLTIRNLFNQEVVDTTNNKNPIELNSEVENLEKNNDIVGNMNQINNNITFTREIEINVSEKILSYTSFESREKIPNYYTNEKVSCCKKYKKRIAIILTILGILIIVGVIIIIICIKKKSKDKKSEKKPNEETKSDSDIIIKPETTNVITDIPTNNEYCETGEEEKCKICDENNIKCIDCNIGYKLVDGKCKSDYFIKLVYFTKQKEDKIDIINSVSDVTHIIIEGKKITPKSTSYQFKEQGNQTVYIQFDNKYSYKERIFEKNKHLISATFSDFGEYKIIIRLYRFFAGCVNLISVDFSKLSYVYADPYGTQYMFDECINLKYVNLKNLKIVSSAEYMFNGCVSLKSIDLSNTDMSGTKTLKKMFADCYSLESINLKGLKFYGESMYYMFENCYSLKEVDLSAFKPLYVKDICGLFYNCSSLTSVNFLDFYSDVLNDLGSLFYNCSSLKEVNIEEFNTKNVRSMQSMFEGCNSLTSIKIGKNFEVSKNIDCIALMFSRCYSLTSINFDIVVTNKVGRLSYLFSDCHSLTSLNLINFDTSNVDQFDYMFHNCYSLKSIDITNFKIKRNSDLKGMFSGCYQIKSINFSTITPEYYRFDEIFYDCPNLNYVDFSFIRNFPYYYFYTPSYYLFNKNISKNGTLIINENYYNRYLKELNIYPPEGWTLNFTN